MSLNQLLAEQKNCLVSYFSVALANYFKNTLEHCVIVFILYTCLSVLLYWLVFKRKCHNKLPPAKRVLIVTAHPDDESMFFGPTIVSLKQRKDCRIFMLCLSNGNYDKKGTVRRQELWNACEALNIDKRDITMFNSTHLQDDPNSEWKVDHVAKIILKFIDMLDVQLLVTFDKNGVSSHQNHCAIFYATASLCFSNLIPKGCKVLTLETVNLFRKYISFFDLPISLLMSTHWSVINWHNRSLVQRAMKYHNSQMLWFRKLYISFSRYMIINSLREINLTEVEFEIIDS